jgi:hypothetical protein
MLSVTPSEYIQLLREKRICTSQQTLFLEYVNLYIDNAKCYKIVLSCNPDQLKRAAKAGIKARFTIIHEGIPQIRISNPPTFDISRGKYFLQYSFRTREILIYAGEDYYLNKIEDAKNKSHSKLRDRISRRNELRSDSNLSGDSPNNVYKTDDNSINDTVHDSSSKLE